jgi:hypothetical protein
MTGCTHCKDVNQTFRIETPGDLSKAIKVIAANIADGTIVAAEQPMGSFTPVPFMDLANGELWDDIVEYNFNCQKCKQKFCLRAETYHGSGGSWSPQTT